MLRLKVDMLISRTSNKCGSERLTDRKLKTLRLVVKRHRVTGKRIQGNPVRETEQAQRGEPLNRDSGRSLKVIISEVIIDRSNVVRPQELDLISRIEDVPHIVEPTDPGGAFPLIRHREQQLEAAHDAQVAAERVADADVVPGAQRALAKAANAVRAAREIIQVRRQE